LHGRESQHGSFDVLIAGIASDRHIRSLSAIDLHRQRNGVLDQEIGFEFGPCLLRD
jgi:hypothetical protein